MTSPLFCLMIIIILILFKKEILKKFHKNHSFNLEPKKIMIQNLKKNQVGLTLLELVIVVSLFSVMILAVSRVFTKTVEIQTRTISEQDLQNNLKYGLGVVLAQSQQAVLHNDNSCSCATCGDLTGKYYGTDVGGNTLYLRQAGVPLPICLKYYLQDGALKADLGGAVSNLTSDDIDVTEVRFKVNSNNDRFTMFLTGTKQDRIEHVVKYQISVTASEYQN